MIKFLRSVAILLTFKLGYFFKCFIIFVIIIHFGYGHADPFIN